MKGMILGFFLLVAIVLGGSFKFVKNFKEDGFVYTIGKAAINDNKFTGVAYQIHTNSKLYKIAFFWDGKQELTEYRWFMTGKKWFEKEFKSGIEHGSTKIWFQSGKVQELKNHMNGKRHGAIWGWHANGVVSNYHVFKEGKQVVSKSFISDGKPFYNYLTKDNKPVGIQGVKFCNTRR